MKKLLTLIVLGMLLSGSVGCRIAECWRYAWNSRFPKHTQQAVVVTDPCVVSDQCAAPCCGAPAITTSPVPVR